MILPSDSDLPPDRNDGTDPMDQPESDPTWWENSKDSEDEDDEGLTEEEDGDIGTPLASIAGPGWRADLHKDLLESLRDLEAIEDPDDEFSPPEPPDLFTFFGEVAALRNDLRNQGRIAQEQLVQINKSLAPLKANPSGKPGKASPPLPAGQNDLSSCSWSVETCIALLSAWDLLPQATAAAAYDAIFQPLFAAAGLTRVTTTGHPFDPAAMALTGQEKAPQKSLVGRVLRETVPGFLRQGMIFRPAGVVVGI